MFWWSLDKVGGYKESLGFVLIGLLFCNFLVCFCELVRMLVVWMLYGRK